MAIESVKLNLKQSAYTTAVTNLNSKLRELINAQDDYDQQRAEIPNFWSGDAEDEAYETIGENIAQVKTAQKNIEENIKAFEEAEQESSQLNADTKQALSDAKAAVKALFN